MALKRPRTARSGLPAPIFCAAKADIDCMLTCFLFCFIGFFNGVGYTGFVMMQGIAGAFLMRVPVSFLMSRRRPVSLFHIGLATPCSSLLKITLCFICFAVWRKRQTGRVLL